MEKELRVEQHPTKDLVPYARNAKKHTAKQVEQIAASIEEFGFNDPVGVWTNAEGQVEIVEGHGRVLAAKKLGMETVPVIHLDSLTDEQRRAYTHVHNQLTMNTGFDLEVLEADLESLDFDFEQLGFLDIGDLEESVFDGVLNQEDNEDVQRKTLTERFGVVPFSVLRANSGEWIDRKRKWVDLGIRSEIGRGGTCFQ